MKTTGKKIASLIAGGALVAAAAPATQLAVADDAVAYESGNPSPAYADPAAQATEASRSRSTIENVRGTFAWDQGVSTDNETLAKVLYRSSAYLCGTLDNQAYAQAGERADSVADIRFIAVTGDVENSFTASVGEFSEKAPVKKIMGCTCSGNPADGRASANAEVSGFLLSALIDAAAPEDGVNTITFTSRDGYEVVLPYAYVMQRYSIIVTNVNGEEAADAIGCSNQLWLGSTSARSFARDIVGIAVTREADPPAAPGANAQANLPNVGITEGTSAT